MNGVYAEEDEPPSGRKARKKRRAKQKKLQAPGQLQIERPEDEEEGEEAAGAEAAAQDVNSGEFL